MKLLDGALTAPVTSTDFSFEESVKTFSLVVRGAGMVSASAEVWWSPTFEHSEAVKIHSLSASGSMTALDFSTSQVCGGQWWAVLTSLTGDSADVLCGVAHE